MGKIIQLGAEAEIILKNKFIIKRRVPKSYRLKELDEKIRKLRTRSESKILEKASKIIPVPEVIKADENKKEIILEFIDGRKLSDFLDKFQLKKQKEICVEIGINIAKLHDTDIIHGDLTTSNMICDSASLHTHRPRIFFIDFGLGFISHKIEDKAVDLHLLKQALEAKHFKNWKILFDSIVMGYGISKNCEKILKRLDVVERRGRYKEKY